MEEINRVEEGLSEKLKDIGYELYSFKFIPKTRMLEIVVDRDEEINLDDITNVSETISSYLDEHDFTDNPYTLDVSSLGVEKPIKLEKLDKYVGKYINIHLSHPYQGENILEGNLDYCDNEKITLSYKNKTKVVKCEINRATIDKARLAIKF